MRRALVVVLGLALLVALTLYAKADLEKRIPKDITKRAKAALVKKGFGDLDVQVDAPKMQVTLSGEVHNIEAKGVAGTIATSIHGVDRRRFLNSVVVRTIGPTKPPTPPFSMQALWQDNRLKLSGDIGPQFRTKMRDHARKLFKGARYIFGSTIHDALAAPKHEAAALVALEALAKISSGKVTITGDQIHFGGTAANQLQQDVATAILQPAVKAPLKLRLALTAIADDDLVEDALNMEEDEVAVLSEDDVAATSTAGDATPETSDGAMTTVDSVGPLDTAAAAVPAAGVDAAPAAPADTAPVKLDTTALAPVDTAPSAAADAAGPATIDTAAAVDTMPAVDTVPAVDTARTAVDTTASGDTANAPDTQAQPTPTADTAQPADVIAVRPITHLDDASCQVALNDLVEGDKRLQFDRRNRLLDRELVKIDQVVDLLNRCPGARVEVQAYWDNYGEPDTVRRRTHRQAATVRKALIERGINPVRLTSRGFGYKRPKHSNATRAGRLLNRRIEFKIKEVR